MSKPTLPSIGTRILYYAAVQPVYSTIAPTTSYVGGNGKTVTTFVNPVAAAAGVPGDVGQAFTNAPGNAGPYPGLVNAVISVAPDVVNLVCYDHAGNAFFRANVQNITQWTSAGSDVTKARFDYVDLTA
jgi:hypothetical protein